MIKQNLLSDRLIQMILFPSSIIIVLCKIIPTHQEENHVISISPRFTATILFSVAESEIDTFDLITAAVSVLFLLQLHTHVHNMCMYL